MKHKIWILKHYLLIGFLIQLILNVILSTTIASCYDTPSVLPDELRWYEKIYLNYVAHWEGTYKDVNSDYYDLSAPGQAESEPDGNLTAESESEPEPEPVRRTPELDVLYGLETPGFSNDLHRLSACVERNLFQAGKNMHFVIQAGDRAVNTIYAGMDSDNALMLIEQIQEYDLSWFGSQEVMTHLMTTLFIKANGHINPDIKEYGVAYTNISEIVAKYYE